MTKNYPLRTLPHQQEEASGRFFTSALPKNWTSEKPSHDYGIDVRVDIFEGEQATGLELLVQLKSSAQPSGKDTETVELKVATFNHLWEKLQVAMLVQFVEAEDEAYWILFRDIPEPSQNAKSFTVHVPKSNRLSTIDWDAICAYVRDVTDTKVAAARASRLAQ